MNVALLVMVFGIIGLFVFVLAWVIYSTRQQKAYRAELAQTLGFTPLEEPDPSILEKIVSVHPRYGTPRYSLKNVSRRSFPYGTIYLYDLLEAGGESVSMVENAAISIFAPGMDLPRFMTYPRLDMGGKLAGWANQLIENLIEAQGFTELDLEKFPDFEKKYFLFAEDEVAINALFSTPLIELLVREVNISIAAGGNVISFSRPDFKNLIKPDESAVRALIDQSLAIYDRLANPTSM
jgi:hypothetical protein